MRLVKITVEYSHHPGDTFGRFCVSMMLDAELGRGYIFRKWEIITDAASDEPAEGWREFQQLVVALPFQPINYDANVRDITLRISHPSYEHDLLEKK